MIPAYFGSPNAWKRSMGFFRRPGCLRNYSRSGFVPAFEHSVTRLNRALIDCPGCRRIPSNAATATPPGTSRQSANQQSGPDSGIREKIRTHQTGENLHRPWDAGVSDALERGFKDMAVENFPANDGQDTGFAPRRQVHGSGIRHRCVLPALSHASICPRTWANHRQTDTPRRNTPGTGRKYAVPCQSSSLIRLWNALRRSSSIGDGRWVARLT